MRSSLGLLLLGLSLLAGCSAGSSDDGSLGGAIGGGDGGGGGDNNNPPTTPPTTPPTPPPPTSPAPMPIQGLEAMIAWGDASGPVAGYSVMISRNDGAFQLERETPIARVLISGAAGEVVRIRVAAFDAAGNAGPLSPASPAMVFTAAAASMPVEPTSDPASSAESIGGSASVASSVASASSEPAPSEDEPVGPRGPGDFDGDGAADLIWETADASLIRVSSADLTSARLYTLPTPGAKLVAVADFDHDGLTDLLFSAAGELLLARGATLPSGAGALTFESWAHPGAGSEVVAAGDFDADGSADVVVMDANGAALWLASGDVLTLPVLGEASIASAGDGDADGSDDLVIRDGQGFSLWRVVGGAVVSATSLPVPMDSTLLGVADFDGDGADELALRTGADAMALQRARTPFEAWLESAPAGASLVGCGDYDRDGVPDRLWKSSAALGIAGSAAGEQVVALEPASPWRLFDSCR